MKKRLSYLKVDSGFYLPYVLFVSVAALSFITASIMIYTNEGKISSQLMEQIEAETLIQMGRAKLITEGTYVGESSGEVMYVFPNGEIRIKYTLIEGELYQLHYYVLTNKNFDFQIIGYLTIIG